ncbi:hypothetical protein GOODEAATRI_019630, partial [Goodea atripinnis]
LASSILNFITTSMLKSRNNFIRNYVSVSLTEQNMATLASIIKDVDKDVKGTLKQHTIQGSIHSEDDLNVEHLQLLLLLFHNLSERGRRSVLAMLTQTIIEVAQSRDSQLKSVPLHLARLLLVFDYLLRHYSKAPLYLFEQVNTLSNYFLFRGQILQIVSINLCLRLGCLKCRPGAMCCP